MAARPFLRRIARAEAAGGIALILAAVAAMVVANGPLAPAYRALLDSEAGPLSVRHWINDGLMALFFLLVGMEVKRELVEGRLASWPDRALPVIAATGGMVVPALIFLAIAGTGGGLARGWAIPSATDIAFAVGVMALLGRRAPAPLRLFLTTVAIVDDIGAVAIIALAYTASIGGLALLAAGIVLAAMWGLNRTGVRALPPYLALAVALWIAVHASGIHATIAGVLAGLAMPLAPSPGGGASPLHRLEHGLAPWVSFAIVPLFGFANAGVPLTGTGMRILAPLPLAVAAGLFAGKQMGVFGAVWGAVRLGIARRPAGAGWLQIYGVSLLCGIGFTMSLFIGGLAFADPQRMDAVRIGILAGSLLSAIAGSLVLIAGYRARNAADAAS